MAIPEFTQSGCVSGWGVESGRLEYRTAATCHDVQDCIPCQNRSGKHGSTKSFLAPILGGEFRVSRLRAGRGRPPWSVSFEATLKLRPNHVRMTSNNVMACPHLPQVGTTCSMGQALVCMRKLRQHTNGMARGAVKACAREDCSGGETWEGRRRRLQLDVSRGFDSEGSEPVRGTLCNPTPNPKRPSRNTIPNDPPEFVCGGPLHLKVVQKLPGDPPPLPNPTSLVDHRTTRTANWGRACGEHTQVGIGTRALRNNTRVSTHRPPGRLAPHGP